MRFAVTLLACVTLVGALAICLRGKLVLVNPSRTSRFIRTYDASKGLGAFGPIRGSSSKAESVAGHHGVWNSREIVLHLHIDAARVPATMAAMQQNVRDTLKNSGLRLVGVNDPGPNTDIAELAYRSRYEDASTTGVVKIGPACRANTPDLFVVPIAIEEQWLPN